MESTELPRESPRLISSEVNTSNGAITLTFANPTLIVKLVEFNSTTYISCGEHLQPLHTFLKVRSAHEKYDGTVTVKFGKGTEEIHLTYEGISALTFATIMSAVEDAIEDNDILTTPRNTITETGYTTTSVLDHILPPPDPNTLYAPNSTPLTVTDQMAFVIGLVAFILATLHTVYLGLYATFH